MDRVVIALMALIGFWLWLYFAALLWDGLGGRWAQKSARGRTWLQAHWNKKDRTARDLLALVGGISYHAIWLHPKISLGVSVVLLAALSYLLLP
jgi:hypothetical protein